MAQLSQKIKMSTVKQQERQLARTIGASVVSLEINEV